MAVTDSDASRRYGMNQYREKIMEAVVAYHEISAGGRPFEPGKTPVPVAGPLFDAADRMALTAAALDMQVGAGDLASDFETEFAGMTGRRSASLVNSGSSANLLAIAALSASSIPPERRLKPGDEVITPGLGFSTTLNPLIQLGLVPVFVDVEPSTLNPTLDSVARAIGPRTRGLMLAHTLGNPFPAAEILRIAEEHSLWLIEDNCDALGATYDGRLTGTFGHLATSSFYPAHQVSMGEGGCIVTDDPFIAKIVNSLRDWGRDCWCRPGEDNRCGMRFDWQAEGLPAHYDHKYIYTQIGYNLKSTDLHAALGMSQLRKLPDFVRARRNNWLSLHEGLAGLPHITFCEPTPNSDPSWFGFVISVSPAAPFVRHDIVSYLEERKIGTRPLLAGNLSRQPAYKDKVFRVAEELSASDLLTAQGFWVGVQPSLNEEVLTYVVESVRNFVTQHKS